MSSHAPSKSARIGAALAVLASCALAGGGVGLLFVRLFVPRKAMGWDGLADMLGGLMVGAAIGVAAATALIALAAVGTQVRAAVGCIVLGVALWAGLAMTAPRREPEPVIERPKPFQPLLRVRARIAYSEDRLAAIAPAERPFSFTEVEVFSAKPELARTGWGGRQDRCRATPGEAQLRALIPAVEAAARETGDICRTPEPDDVLLAFNWNLGGERGGRSLEAGCLESELPGLGRLASELDELAKTLCPPTP